MRKTLVAAALSAIASVALAHDQQYGGNADLYSSPLLDHGPGGPTGEPQKGRGDMYASIVENPPQLVKAHPKPEAEPWDPADAWKGWGDEYQNIMIGSQ
jgi:hypothetical protein